MRNFTSLQKIKLTFTAVFLLVWGAGQPLQAAAPVGVKLPTVVLQGDTGDKVLGGAWSSESMKGIFHVFFYVDPDEKALNEHAAEAFKAAQRDKTKYGSVAIINMKATWLPNIAVRTTLKLKQKRHPHTLYVMDFEKVFVNKWNLGDNNNDLVVFDAEGNVLFSKDGKLTDEDVQVVIGFIREHTGPNMEPTQSPVVHNK